MALEGFGTRHSIVVYCLWLCGAIVAKLSSCCRKYKNLRCSFSGPLPKRFVRLQQDCSCLFIWLFSDNSRRTFKCCLLLLQPWSGDMKRDFWLSFGIWSFRSSAWKRSLAACVKQLECSSLGCGGHFWVLLCHCGEDCVKPAPATAQPPAWLPGPCGRALPVRAFLGIASQMVSFALVGAGLVLRRTDVCLQWLDPNSDAQWSALF